MRIVSQGCIMRNNMAIDSSLSIVVKKFNIIQSIYQKGHRLSFVAVNTSGTSVRHETYFSFCRQNCRTKLRALVRIPQ